ncbi:DUF2569 family protein [Sulfuricella sp. T08]|uniref:DUF2569 family protein n=1 Tax=Sulfuricella sp. T08 TaxID=1632857 RepID=UPI00075166BF|nr:DUF2569 family protein [Sulfuricella sp. T08]
MPYDSSTRTLLIAADDASGHGFLLDLGLFYINVLRDMALDPKASSQLRAEWQTIENWLGSSGREFNDDDTKKITDAWAAYLAIGVAPTSDLQPMFSMISKRSDAEQLKRHTPPTNILDVFERILATDDEFRANKSAKIERAIALHSALSPPPTIGLKVKLNGLGRFGRAYLICSVVWALFVLFRTNTSFEFLGHYFDYWDSDSFFVNLVIPPFAVLVGLKGYQWIIYGFQGQGTQRSIAETGSREDPSEDGLQIAQKEVGNMYCTQCGSEILIGAHFCHKCGAAVGSTQASAILLPPVVQPTVTKVATADATLKGVKGWLAFLCISLTILSPLSTIVELIRAWEATASLFSSFPSMRIMVSIETTMSIWLMAFSFYAGSVLWSVKQNAVKIAKAYFLSRLAYSIALPFIFSGISDLPSEVSSVMVEELAKQAFLTFMACAIWFTYLRRSKRVRATYST